MKPFIRAIRDDGSILLLDRGATSLPGDGGYCCFIEEVPVNSRDLDTFPVVSRGGMTSLEAVRWGVMWLTKYKGLQ